RSWTWEGSMRTSTKVGLELTAVSCSDRRREESRRRSVAEPDGEQDGEAGGEREEQRRPDHRAALGRARAGDTPEAADHVGHGAVHALEISASAGLGTGAALLHTLLRRGVALLLVARHRARRIRRSPPRGNRVAPLRSRPIVGSCPP